MFMFVGLGLFYWNVLRAEIILTRNDNPRILEQELRILRGEILDRNGKVLAVSSGEPDRLQRVYPIPEVGPAVGFYSITHGTAGVEDGFDEILRNNPDDWWTALAQSALHLPQEGRGIKLALDADLQLAAEAALGEARGAVLMFGINGDDPYRAWIHVMVSHPGFDPNFLDEQFEELGSNENAPLLNRVTQGQYQPGLLLQPLILASALDNGQISLSDPVESANRPIEINGATLQCKDPPPDPASWADVLRFQCPGPYVDIADQVGVRGLDSLFSSFGLDTDPALELETETPPDEPLDDPQLASIGYDKLTTTPLKIGLAMSALVNGGRLPQPQIGIETQDRDGNWQSWLLPVQEGQAISAQAAEAVRDVLSPDDSDLEYSLLVISGPDETTNAWYMGSAKVDNIQYVVVAVIEDSKREDRVQRLGRSLLSAVRNI
ncbi:MAG: penicillin-binding transpeptidase domain-containing protein [Candidatus Promineifilaceae bacterium]|nr:penicillin-binding transpeptidase domain-containing protein [Candidatus Promineifilaceae bacterium]